METSSRCLQLLTFIVFEIVALGSTTPVWNPQSNSGFGRNIRHLPCLSRRTGETGVCMFAFSCAKANGTHLGTCIDRFYFGSCCKLAVNSEHVAEPLDSNHIFEESPTPSTENYHLSTYQSVQTVKNTTDKPAAQSTTTPRYSPTPESTTPKPTKRPPTTVKPPVTPPLAPYTHKPVPPSKPYTQTSTTKPKPSGKPPLKPQTTGKPALVSKPSSNVTSSSKPPLKPPLKPPGKPTVSTKPKPSNTTSYPKPTAKPPQKPSNGTSNKPIKPAPTKRPSISSTSKPVQLQPQRPGPSTSKPISNQKPQTRPTVGTRPPTKPPLKPVPVVATVTTTDPNYIKVPVVTVSTSSKPTTEPTTISNEVVPTASSEPPKNSSQENEEESSNVIAEVPVTPTTSSPLLVTWTTVDEVPLPPLPKPGSTPTTVKNETKPTTTSTTTSTTTVATTQSSQSWVQVSVSTPSPSTESTRPDLTVAPNTTVAASPSPSPVPEKPTTTGANKTEASTTESTPSTATSNITIHTDNSTTTAPSVDNEIHVDNVNMSDYLDVCGRRLFPQSRIVGGDKATFGKWPWQISLRQWRTSTYLHKCGAALLNENWAITAAHCVENVAPSDLLLRLGEHDLSLEDEPYGYQERRVQIVASHPQFDPRTFEYDLALLRFYEPVTFQPNIIPVCVPQDDTNFVGSTAYVTGWGRLYEDGPLPSVLQEVSVPVINNTVCETMYRAAGYIEHIPEIFICAGWKKGGFDSCEGDSGGPMVIQRPDKRWLLAGVISWGIGCAEPNQPGVYTRISEFRGWINQILQF